MFTSLTILILALAGPPQSIEPVAVMGQVGVDLRIRVWDEAGRPLPGVAVSMLSPAGERTAIGSTNDLGQVGVVPTMPGQHRVYAMVDGVELIAALTVVERPMRLGLFLLALPLAAWSIWRYLLQPRRAHAATSV